jgi:lysophospholipase L1-like esterase
MKTVLCYGDSNTHGSDPAGGARFAEDVRWPGVLRDRLGEGYRVIEEGLPGRTTVRDDPVEGTDRNGRAYLSACLQSHAPLDLVLIMLGTNDLKRRFDASAADIAQGAASLAPLAVLSGAGPGGGPPEVVLISPPPVARLTGFAGLFEGAQEKSRRFAQEYRNFAELYGLRYFDAGSVAASSDLDGIHLEASEHRKLGEALAAVVREAIG